MMSKFIEVHLAKDDCLASLNVEKIVGLADFNDGEGYIIKTSDRGDWIVKESYDELKQLIQDAGILIHKPDPRLNLTKPLSMDDLREMIGEPVWNSNTLKWELVWYYGDAREIIFTRDCGADYEYNADDLIKTPLYRMKQEVK